MAASKSAVCVLTFAIVLFAIKVPAFSMSNKQTFDGFSKRLWESKDGLPDQTVNALAQTSDGSLWIGTEGGLVRFDGLRFSSYSRDLVPDGIDRGVRALLVARSGDLWIGTEGAGVIRYRNQIFQSLRTVEGKGSIFVRTIYQDRSGTIWVGSDQGLFRVNNDSLVRIDNRPQLPAMFVRTIAEDVDGHLWVGGTRLWELSGETPLRNYPLPTLSSKSMVMSMRCDADGTMWLGMRSGLYRLTKAGRIDRAFELSAPIDEITPDANGKVWVGSEGQGLYYIRDSRLYHVSPDQLPSETVEVVFKDRSGNLWLGTKAGLVRLSPTPVSIIALPGGVDSQFETLYIDRDQSVWVAAATHLFRIHDGVAHPFKFPGLPGIRVRTLMRDRQGDLWIGTDGMGLFHLAHGVSRPYRAGRELSNDYIRVIMQSRDGTMWIGTDGGLTHITAAGSEKFQPERGLAYFNINALCEDRDGNIWVATSRGLSRLIDGKIVHDNITSALSQEDISSICQDASGVIWLGTGHGLYGIRNGNVIHIIAADGLASNRVLQILQDGRNNIWLTGPTSISRIGESDLDAYHAGSGIKLNFYQDPYSLESTAFYRGMQPEGAIAANGDIWFASSKGAVRISPQRIVQSELSPVTIDEVRADDRQLQLSSRITLKPGNARFEISYSSVNLSAQGGLRYRYQMEGLEPWIDAGIRRTAYYTHIPSGHYRFRVQAYEIGNPSEVSEKSIVVVQDPPLYKSPWFFALAGLAVLAILFSVYRFRLHQLHAQFQAINAERTRIAREMHDTVIQECVGVSTLLEAAQGLDAVDDPLRVHLLAYAADQVRSTIDSARGAVWALRNISKSDGNLGEHCRELVRNVQLKADIPIQFETKGPPFKLGEDATHELLMTVKEALTNAIAHADATGIRLTVAFEPTGVEIEVSDNGIGVDLDHLTKVKGHYGMIGMTERVKLLGGVLGIETAKGKGTTIRISIPQNTGTLR